MKRSARAGTPGTGGVYCLLVELSKPRRIKTGALGWRLYTPGLYVYVGSAQKALFARLARHLTEKKTRKWHIDYLLSGAKVRYIIAWNLPKAAECRLARKVSKIKGAQAACSGFGSSDCNCQTHLFRFD